MNNQHSKNKFHKIIMIICCTIPLIILGVLYFSKLQGTALGSILGFGAILLCPLMHLIMMPLMMRSMRKNGTEDNKPSCH